MNRKKTSKKQNICGNTCCNKQVCEAKSDMSCFNKIAGTLTGEEIRKHGIINTSLEEYSGEDNCFQPTTYDLRLGDAHYIYEATSNTGSTKWKQVFIGDNNKFEELNNTEPKFERLPGANMGILKIPPFASALIQLEEIVDTFSATEKNVLIVGRFDLKLSKVHQALISQQATQVEPCYKGKLFCFLHNLSNNAIEIKYKEKVATIEFSYVSCFCNKEKRKELINTLTDKNISKYSNEIYCYPNRGIKDIRYFAQQNTLPDDCGLASFHNSFYKKQEEIEKWTKDKCNTFIKEGDTINNVANIVGERLNLRFKIILQWVTIIISLLGFVGGALYKYSEIKTNLEREVENHKKTIQEQEDRIRKLEDKLDETIKTINTQTSGSVTTPPKTKGKGG
jgi:deoxycytidine triphosphate deaminase